MIGDPTVGVTRIGADGEPAVAVGGRLIGGAFASNRTADTRGLAQDWICSARVTSATTRGFL